MEFQEYIIVNLTWVSLTLLAETDLKPIAARNLLTPIGEIVLLKEAFCGLPGTKLSKLKKLHSEVFTKIHWGRLMVFFCEQLDLTEEE